MRCILVGLLLIVACQPVLATVKQVDPAYLASIRDDNPNPLPRGFSAEELLNHVAPRIPDHVLAPPPGTARAQAEYEGNQGLMVRWGSFNSLLTEMAVAITTGDRSARMYVVVTGTSQQNSAASTLAGAGANMDRVGFITQPCSNSSQCSVWMRDYGPRFIEDSGRLGMIDHVYNRPQRIVDDAYPDVASAVRGEPNYDIPLIHGGGNFHLFRNRDAFMTRLIVNENPGVSEQQIRDYYAVYQGLDVTLTDPFPSSYDSTQHIDMWMLPLADNTVLIGQYAAGEGGGVPKSVTDAVASQMQARGYTVYRTPGWRAGGAHYTYTNAVLLNDLALICRFGGSYAAQDAQALATFQTALPGRTIVPVDCSGIIGSAGAIHCIVMHVPDLLFRDEFEGVE